MTENDARKDGDPVRKTHLDSLLQHFEKWWDKIGKERLQMPSPKRDDPRTEAKQLVRILRATNKWPEQGCLTIGNSEQGAPELEISYKTAASKSKAISHLNRCLTDLAHELRLTCAPHFVKNIRLGYWEFRWVAVPSKSSGEDAYAWFQSRAQPCTLLVFAQANDAYRHMADYIGTRKRGTITGATLLQHSLTYGQGVARALSEHGVKPKVFVQARETVWRLLGWYGVHQHSLQTRQITRDFRDHGVEMDWIHYLPPGSMSGILIKEQDSEYLLLGWYLYWSLKGHYNKSADEEHQNRPTEDCDGEGNVLRHLGRIHGHDAGAVLIFESVPGQDHDQARKQAESFRTLRNFFMEQIEQLEQENKYNPAIPDEDEYKWLRATLVDLNQIISTHNIALGKRQEGKVSGSGKKAKEK